MLGEDEGSEEVPQFSKTSGELFQSLTAYESNRYNTIEVDDDEVDVDVEGEDEDDAASKGLEWMIDPVSNQQDDEKLIDENLEQVAMEIITSGTSIRRDQQRRRQKNVKNRKNVLDLDDEDMFSSPPKPKEIVKKVEEEKGDYQDNNYWRAPNVCGDINDLLENYSV